MALAAEQRGEQFGAAPGAEVLAPSVSLTADGTYLVMGRLRLARAADGSLIGALGRLAQLSHEHRGTTCAESAALHLLPMRPWREARDPGAVRSTGSSLYYDQWREAHVPGRDAELFSLLPAREDVPPGTPLHGTRWLEWPEDDEQDTETSWGWRFTELEGYRLLDVGASGHHTTQTRGMAAGRLAFVFQGHGRISLVLVCAHGASILVRETRSRQ